ncbi:MAG: aminotransferase class III-fold pyridoxal phosphate-dependent enzyme [Ideonella sp.]|nr:aminotransferase class III-fold pyridoxal phosphate-dependent enzyme [Ideonella sp.]MCC7456642.1 aminotransferase class III-fold pyridoxal phosphate-dependent enzyme [Nitrospira sp.]
MIHLDPARLDAWLTREQARYARMRPRSRAAWQQGQQHWLYGAPSHWMRRWASGFPMQLDAAVGARLRCVDGIDHADFCLGDSGAMAGHAAPTVTAAVAAQLARGATAMLPGAQAAAVGAELARRFRLPYWGVTTSASDANRAAIRIARMVSGRERVLVFDGCYHGSVEEAHVAFDDAGRVVLRNGIHANAVDHARVSRLVAFNDEAALAAALAPRDVACVLAEPFMTNFGMIAPAPGFLDTLRRLTRESGTLLVIDETHTLSSGVGGHAAQVGLEPDLLVVGKSIGGGVPVAVYGLAEPVAQALWAQVPKVDPARVRQSAHLGFGGTLAGSTLQVAAMHAVLHEVLTADAFAHMAAQAEQLAAGARAVVAAHALPWHVAQLGARVELMFEARPPRDAADVRRGRNALLEALLHVYAMNRGVLITPFHCMLLMCPATGAAEVQRFVEMLDGFCGELKGSVA